MNIKKYIPMGILLLLVSLFPIIVRNGYIIQFAINILMFAYFSLNWNIIGGYAGQFALGNGVYIGIGAYVSTILFTHINISPWIGIIAAGLVAGCIALALGSLTFRLSGSYFALSTVALLYIAKMYFMSTDSILGYKINGALGMLVPWRGENFLNMQFIHKAGYFYIILFMLIVAVCISNYILKSKTGYYLKAINNSQDAAASLGVNVKGMKQKAGFISAFMLAGGGTFYAQLIQIVDPSRLFGYELSVQLMFYAVIGGRQTLWGPIAATIILVPLNDALRAWLGASMAGLPFIIYGILFIAIIMFVPEGIWPYVQKWSGKVFKKNT